MKHFRNNRFVMVAIILSSFFIIMTMTSSFVSKDKAIDTLIEAYEKKDVTLLQSVLASSSQIYSDAELLAFIDYLYSSESDFQLFIKEVNEKRDTATLDHPAFTIIKEEKSTFKKEYVVKIKPIEVTFRVEDYIEAIEWNGQLLAPNKKITMIPAIIVVKLHILTNDDISFTEQQTINLDPTHRSKHFYINLESTSFITLDSNFDDVTIYINGKDTGEEIKFSNYSGKLYGPVPFDGSVTVAVGKKFPWGEVVSPEIPIINRKEYINLEAANTQITSQITSIITEYAESVLKAWQKKDATMLKHMYQESILAEESLMEQHDIPTDVELDRFSVEDVRVIQDYQFAEQGIAAIVRTNEKYKYAGKKIDRYERYYLVFNEEEETWYVVNYESLPLYSYFFD
ncbi:hypothetical protein CIB95_14330 [Lottiidibacillus patelloidae]|uniref:TcaA 4th domain-containing protein n=1 Tax=Lottiidibacillus patelloidae TaxID=2670334 RepID=A0A263BS55_9BACI|nr:hypothetical protein [Lottiidibacillus patelloidae]OZM56016.1 hypothetical protein CIB95_14330 [Lottiidibacillus patelloidae]